MLKPSEREKLQDCLLLVQSAQSILSAVPPHIAQDLSEVENCFRSADQAILRLLRA